ncbi:hypothetical protein [Burkholderia lata]|uniref:hypothetical protein n=1 Tax=Burkholderia lata (strain ATCC 17760 / DSM 23089 / LMG 22485 / NCIMB 9086 / R18194 / 383) TaxID=482957 RepID=UPI0015838258|nr:hypothetical protein [Burkholderia lata]
MIDEWVTDKTPRSDKAMLAETRAEVTEPNHLYRARRPLFSAKWPFGQRRRTTALGREPPSELRAKPVTSPWSKVGKAWCQPCALREHATYAI